VTLPEGVEMVMPGDNIKMVVELINPVAMDEGLRFAIREGGRTGRRRRGGEDPQVRKSGGFRGNGLPFPLDTP
jgi:hypothetical protein